MYFPLMSEPVIPQHHSSTSFVHIRNNYSVESKNYNILSLNTSLTVSSKRTSRKPSETYHHVRSRNTDTALASPTKIDSCCPELEKTTTPQTAVSSTFTTPQEEKVVSSKQISDTDNCSCEHVVATEASFITSSFTTSTALNNNSVVSSNCIRGNVEEKIEKKEIGIDEEDIVITNTEDSTICNSSTENSKCRVTAKNSTQNLTVKRTNTLKSLSRAIFGGFLCCFGTNAGCNQRSTTLTNGGKFSPQTTPTNENNASSVQQTDNSAPQQDLHQEHKKQGEKEEYKERKKKEKNTGAKTKKTRSTFSSRSSEHSRAMKQDGNGENEQTVYPDLITSTVYQRTFTSCKRVTNVRKYPHPSSYRYLLPEQPPEKRQKKTLVLDLDETLVHSSFKVVHNADFVVPIEIENTTHQVYVCKRPGVDEFLEEVGKYFEVVVFTASLSKYADPVLDILDKNKVITARLFREACTFMNGSYVKDLSRLGRDLSQVVIIDNSPTCYSLQPQNAVAITTWLDDRSDQELHQLLPWLQKTSLDREVYDVLYELRSHAFP